jgi:hypothetical protein
MDPKPTGKKTTDIGGSDPGRLDMLPLGVLARMIVEHSNADALNEVHCRTLFAVRGHAPMRLTEFLLLLCDQSRKKGEWAAETAYDLAIDKFSRLPAQALDQDGSPRRSGVDCRLYYGAYVGFLDRNEHRMKRMSELGREEFQARALQSLVRKHYQLSFKEQQRRSNMTRYVWRLPTGHLNLRMPSHITGQARRVWLETNIPDVDPCRLDEEQRVQAIIDDSFASAGMVPLHEERDLPVEPSINAPVPVPGEDLFLVSEKGLAWTVAREKAANIAEQRPAIRELGPESLIELVHTIFSRLEEESLELREIAELFMLSPATLTRFAGTRWQTSGENIPDLWRNTAQVIGSDPDFREAALRAGIWSRVKEVME